MGVPAAAAAAGDDTKRESVGVIMKYETSEDCVRYLQNLVALRVEWAEQHGYNGDIEQELSVLRFLIREFSNENS